MPSLSEGHLPTRELAAVTTTQLGPTTERSNFPQRSAGYECDWRWIVNRWQALVEIVKSFNERGATTIAFAALCVFVIAPILILL